MRRYVYLAIFLAALTVFSLRTTVFGQNSCFLQYAGDINCNGTIDLADFEIWRRGYLGNPITPSGGSQPSVTPTVTPIGNVGGVWLPKTDSPIHWHWQLSENFQYPRDVKSGVTVYDIDGEYASVQTVSQLHALGSNVKVICYIDVGVYENYRSDANKFPQSVIGNSDVGWNGSYWLDIRQINILKPIMEARIRDWCKAKGFDAVEPDESEVSNNNSGFSISPQQNVAYSKMIADLVHSYGMSVGLKGNNAEAADYEPFSDWSLSEQCFEYGECDSLYNAFAAKGKAVFIIEYNVNPDCTWANSHHVNAARRDLDLVGPTNGNYLYQPCVPDNQSSW